MDALASSLKQMLVTILTVGEQKMTGSMQGVAPHFENDAIMIFRIWFDLQHLDIKLQSCFLYLTGEKEYYGLSSFILYLHRKENLIKNIKYQGTNRCRHPLGVYEKGIWMV